MELIHMTLNDFLDGNDHFAASIGAQLTEAAKVMSALNSMLLSAPKSRTITAFHTAISRSVLRTVRSWPL